MRYRVEQGGVYTLFVYVNGFVLPDSPFLITGGALCPPGWRLNGVTQCSPCLANTYTDVSNLAECIPCPGGAQSPTLSISVLNCTCPPTLYTPSGVAGTACAGCPACARCAGGTVPPVSLPGCFGPLDDGSFVECTLPEACIGNGKCKKGHTGALCA